MIEGLTYTKSLDIVTDSQFILLAIKSLNILTDSQFNLLAKLLLVVPSS